MAQPIGERASTLHDLLPHRAFSQCHELWIPDKATFGPGCLPVVVYIPTIFSLIVFLLALPLRQLIRSAYPEWLRSFAREERSECKLAPDPSLSSPWPPSSPSSSPWWPQQPAALLLALASSSALFSAVASLSGSRSPLFLIPFAPATVSALIVAVTRPRLVPKWILLINLFTALVLIVASLALAGGPLFPAARSWGSAAWWINVLLSLATIWVIVRMPLRDPRVDSSGISPVGAVPKSDLRSPEDNLTLWDWMTVRWLGPLMVVAAAGRQMDEEDVWGLPLEFTHTRLFNRFREIGGSLGWRLIRVSARDLILAATLAISQAILGMAEVVLMRQILISLRLGDRRAAVAYVVLTFVFHLVEAQLGVFMMWSNRRSYERVRGELMVTVYAKALRRKAFTFGGSAPPTDQRQPLVQSSEQSSETASVGEGGEMGEGGGMGDGAGMGDGGLAAAATETTPLISSPPSSQPRKGTPTPKVTWSDLLSRIVPDWSKMKGPKKGGGEPSNAPPPPASAGKVFDLLKHDTYEVAERFQRWGRTAVVPVRVLMALYLLWLFFGPSLFLGVGMVVLFQGVSAVLVRIQTRYERRRREIRDEKLQITTNYIQAIRHLRWYDWQDKWLGRILAAREKELVMSVVTNSFYYFNSIVNMSASTFFPCAVFYAFTVLASRKLSVETAFPALGLCSDLTDAMQDIPGLVQTHLEAWVAMGRLRSFMDEPEKEESRDGAAESEGADQDRQRRYLRLAERPHAEIRDGAFSWPGVPHRTLAHVTAAFPVGLTVVQGPVGAGKSALLQALLGEMDRREGEVGVSVEPIGFCNQTPFLESLAIRDNILFTGGGGMDPVRYRQVLDACCLVPDLAGFQGGDLVQIGENGIGLSGGQKARIGLARAVYSTARILLLDDPIAALDHCTAETIMTRLFKGSLLRDRIVVFVTHRLDLVLPYATQLLEIRHGRVRQVGLDDGEALRRMGRDRDEYECRLGADDAKDAVPDRFIEKEYRAEGAVLASVYWRYVKYGSYWLWAGLVVMMVLFRVCHVSYYYFLRIWGEAYGRDSSRHGHAGQPGPGGGDDSSWTGHFRDLLGLPNPNDDVMPWLLWFFIMACGKMATWIAAEVFIVGLLYVSGRRIFSRVIRAVSGAEFRFYDVTPLGRLLNRLTSDMKAIDGTALSHIQSLAWFAVGWASALAVIASAAPLFLGVAVVTSALFVYLFGRFFPTAQSMRRLETVHRSPLLSNFGVLMDGLVTIRAYRAEPHFQRRTFQSVDAFQTMDHFYWSCQNWLQLRFDLISSGSTLVLSLLAVLGSLSEGAVAFVLTAATGLVGYTHSLCQTYGSMQMEFVSIERVMELLDVEQEPAGGVEPAAAWPAGVDITFDNVTVRYAPHMEPAVRGVSFRIPAGSSVAVTGRTGSGKSTLAMALLGTILSDDGGDIWIGGVSVSRVNKRTLRSRISFVAQDPVLFAGNLWDNLDPQREHSEKECAAILERVLAGTGGGTDAPAPPPASGSGSAVAAVAAAASASASAAVSGGLVRERFTLQSRVDGGGLNLSQGQRQLIGIGRAILRRSNIVILDEATASIDAATADEIHAILRTELAGSTVITIAHRPEAVAGAEYQLEMSQGQVKSFGRFEGGRGLGGEGR